MKVEHWKTGVYLWPKHKIIDFFVGSNMKVYLEIEIDQEVNEEMGGRVSKRE